jgi:hypothetical protein
MKNRIFIPGDVPSSKNGRVWTGRFFVEKNAVKKYKKFSESAWRDNTDVFLKMIEGKEPPYSVNFKFIRGTRRKFDYINMLQTVQDLMVKNDWIEDDNFTFLIPVIEVCEYCKESPGIYINAI